MQMNSAHWKWKTIHIVECSKGLYRQRTIQVFAIAHTFSCRNNCKTLKHQSEIVTMRRIIDMDNPINGNLECAGGHFYYKLCVKLYSLHAFPFQLKYRIFYLHWIEAQGRSIQLRKLSIFRLHRQQFKKKLNFAYSPNSPEFCRFNGRPVFALFAW